MYPPPHKSAACILLIISQLTWYADFWCRLLTFENFCQSLFRSRPFVRLRCSWLMSALSLSLSLYTHTHTHTHSLTQSVSDSLTHSLSFILTVTCMYTVLHFHRVRAQGGSGSGFRVQGLHYQLRLATQYITTHEIS